MKETSDRLEWHPNPGKQTEALTWRIYELLYGGARGGGKSEAGRAWMTIDIENPLYRGLVIRKNATDLTDWRDKAKQMYRGLGAEFVSNEIRFPYGSIIYTGHLKDEDSYEKYQGNEIHRLLLEELTQIPSEDRYLRLLSSVRSTVPGLKARVFATANPGGKGHAWVKRRFVDIAPPMTPFKDPVSGRYRIYIPATVDDNPVLLANDPDYVRFLDSLPENLRKAWRYGRWDVFAGQYFAEWNPEVHVIKPFKIPDSWKKIGGYDHGRTKPACFKWYAIDHDGNVYVYRELYVNKEDGSPRWEAEDIAKEVVRITREAGEVLEYAVADSAIFTKTGMGETLADIFRKNGVGAGLDSPIPLLIPSHKDRIAGWGIMHQHLKYDATHIPKMRYFETCYDSIRTLPELYHDEIRPEDLDSDGEDHAADVDRYVLQTLKDKRSPAPLGSEERRILDFKKKLGIAHQADSINMNRFDV